MTAEVALKTNNAVEVLEALLPVKNESFNLGIKLGLPVETVEAIFREYSEQRHRLLQVILQFIRRAETMATWRDIIEALRSPVVGNNALAKRLEEKYCPDPIVVTPSDPVRHAPRSSTSSQSAAESCCSEVFQEAREIRTEIKQLQQRFKDYKKNVKQCLRNHRVHTKDVADELKSVSVDVVEEHHVRTVNDLSIEELYTAANHDMLFGAVGSSWNYLDPVLLNHLVDEFKLDEVEVEMESYQVDLKQFRKRTPLKLFMAAQKRKRPIEAPQEFQENFSKFDWPENVTLEVVEQFREERTPQYNLQDCAAMVNSLCDHDRVVSDEEAEEQSAPRRARC